jgi:hypothetical protein
LRAAGGRNNYGSFAQRDDHSQYRADGRGSVFRPAIAHPRGIFRELAGRGLDPAAALALARARCIGSPRSLVSDPPLALLILVFCVFLVVIYRLSVVISDLKDANIAMAQRLAILEFELQSLNEKR